MTEFVLQGQQDNNSTKLDMIIQSVNTLATAVGTLQRRGDENLVSLKALADEFKTFREEGRTSTHPISQQSPSKSSPFKPIGDRQRPGSVGSTQPLNQSEIDRLNACSEPWFVAWLEKLTKRNDPTRVSMLSHIILIICDH
jgi:hypothetical protein